MLPSRSHISVRLAHKKAIQHHPYGREEIKSPLSLDNLIADPLQDQIKCSSVASLMSLKERTKNDEKIIKNDGIPKKPNLGGF